MSIRMSADNIEYSRDYHEGGGSEPIIHVFGRDDKGNSQRVDIRGVRPYFYIRTDYAYLKILVDSDPFIVDYEKEPYIDIYGNEVYKVFVKDPYEIYLAKQRYMHYEADVPFPDKFVIDNNIKYGIEVDKNDTTIDNLKAIDLITPLRYNIIDIEADDSDGFPDPKDNCINCLTVYDSFDDKYYVMFLINADNNDVSEEFLLKEFPEDLRLKTKLYTFRSEVDLLKTLVKLITNLDPDVLTGWNFSPADGSDGFDMPYIMKRMMALGIDPMDMGRLKGTYKPRYPSVRGRVSFDLLTAYKKLLAGRKQSYRLDAVAEEELGERKVHHEGLLSSMWRDDPAKFIYYNVIDVKLCVGINNKYNIIDFYRMLANYVGCKMDRTFQKSKLIDMFLLEFGHGKSIFPSSPDYKPEDNAFKGALVMDAATGLFNWVAVLDLTSLYPMIMMTLNASTETKSEDGELVAPNGIRYKKEPDGLTRNIMDYLFEERKTLKKKRDSYTEKDPEYVLYDMQQRVIKEIMNTYYGASGYLKFRTRDKDVGASVTSVGRALIGYTREVVEEAGYRVIYGDTDSVMVLMNSTSKEEALEKGFALDKVINDSYDKFAKDVINADKHYFSIKFEKLYKRFLQTGKKKKYATSLVWKEGVDFDNKIDIVGFEYTRSDQSAILREVQKNMIEMLINGVDREIIIKYIRECVGKFLNSEYNYEQIGVPGGLGKSIKNYESKTSHVRGAEYSNIYLKTHFKRGSKPKHLYIKNVLNTYPRTDVVCFEYASDIPSQFIVDYDVMLDKAFRKPLERILVEVGILWSECVPSITTLDMFF